MKAMLIANHLSSTYQNLAPHFVKINKSSLYKIHIPLCHRYPLLLSNVNLKFNYTSGILQQQITNLISLFSKIYNCPVFAGMNILLSFLPTCWSWGTVSVAITSRDSLNPLRQSWNHLQLFECLKLKNSHEIFKSWKLW